MVGEWALPEDMVDNLPPSNNCILGHVIHRLIEKSLPPRVESTVPEFPSKAIKGCILGKTFSGKTTVLKFLQKDFPIQVLSIDTLLQEAIQAFHDKETVCEALPDHSEAEGKALPDWHRNESQDLQNKFSADPVSDEVLPETEDKTILSTDTSKTPKAEEDKSSDYFSKLTVRAQLGAKSEEMLKKGKSVPDLLLVSILVNAINQIPVDQGWVLDGFPMTVNQAKLLEDALSGCSGNPEELEGKNTHTLAVDPTAAKEVPLRPPALDFVILLDISNNLSLDRMSNIMAKAFPTRTLHEDINQRVAAENEDTDDDQNLRHQIQHRILGFMDNWPLLQQWFLEPGNILIKINAEVDKESLCQKVKEIFMNEIVKKENKVKKKLEEKEAERKEVSLAEAAALLPPPPPPPEPEKGKETHPPHEHSKTPPAKGKPPPEPQRGRQESLQEGKGKKGDTSLKRKGAADKGSPKGKSSGGKIPGKKSPAESTVVSPTPAVPPPPKPGSEEWVYVNEPIPEEIPLFLVPYWELIENYYVDSIKTVLRNLREDQHIVLNFLYKIRTSFQQFLRRPDHKQNFVSQWQADFNSLPEDLWEDEETKSEMHQRVNDLRDCLWDICDARKEEAEQERLDIINKSWLQDSIGIMMNNFFSLMQAELNRFQDTKRLLHDYYQGMECKIPTEDNKKFTHIPLVQIDNKEVLESHLRIPLASRISISPDSAVSKPKTKTILKGKIDHSLEKVELNLEADEKLVTDTWQQASLAISHMVAAEIHQRLLEEEKENQPAETKEKSPQMNANKKVAKEPPTKKRADKNKKDKSPPIVEATPAKETPEVTAEMEKKSELRLKIKEEHLAALQFEERATQFRLELIKTKALAAFEDLVTKVVDVYKLMEKWLGERYLHEMASVEKLTEVARYHIETSTKIQNELYLDQEDFFINGDIKVFPDPPPPIRPLPVEKEENGTLTIEQLDSFRDQFLEIAPKDRDPPCHGSQVTEKQRKSHSLDHYLPKRNNQFLKIWLKKYPWLVYDEIPNLMFCGLCRKHGVKSRGSQVSLSYGTDHFSAAFLNAHHLSEAHTQASLMEAAKGSPVNRASSKLTVRTLSKVTLARVENLFRSCHAIAKAGRPFRDFIWMCKLDDMKGVDIGPVFRTNKSARTFTYFIAEVERRNLRDKLEKSPFFSVISNGLSAGSTEDTELVYVQFAHTGKVHCQLAGVQTVEKKDPLSIKIAIEKTLERNLQLRLSDQDWAEKLVGFGRDGAPGSEGESRGVALLLREIQPRVLTVYCFAHHLELLYRVVFQSIPLYNDVRGLLHGVYHFYHRSPLRTRSLIDVFRGLHLRPVMPTQAGDQRWLQGLQAALQNLLKGYPAIVQQLRSTGEGRSDASHQKAKELLEVLLRADIVKFVHFLVDVIRVLSILSHVSRNRNSSIADVFATLESTLEMLHMYQMRPGPEEHRVDSVTRFHGNCLKEKGNISDVRNMVLTHLIKRLQACFRDASQDVVKATVIGSFKLWPTKKNQGIIGNKAFTDILLDLVTLNLGTNNLPSSWMHLTRPELQELTALLTVNSDFVDWRKFLLVASLPWPIPLEEELLETLRRFKAVDKEQSGNITFKQYTQAGLWFTGDEDIKIPENPFEPLPFNRQEHLIEFFFRLFADCEKDPPCLDYTQMLLYFACHPDPVEGVYRALSVAIGTHIFWPIKTTTYATEEVFSLIDMAPIQEYPETEENIVSEKREVREEREAKEEEIPENANTEKISMETLLNVFRGGNGGWSTNQLARNLRREDSHAENFIKVFQDLGAKNLEPIEVALLLKHPFIQDLISSYPDYKLPDIKIILQRSEHVQGSDEDRSPSRLTEEKK